MLARPKLGLVHFYSAIATLLLSLAFLTILPNFLNLIWSIPMKSNTNTLKLIILKHIKNAPPYFVRLTT